MVAAAKATWMGAVVAAKFFSAHVDLFTAGVCTELAAEEVEVRLNREHPTGTTHAWVFVAKLEDGTVLPVPCPDDSRRKHYLFEC